MESVKGNSNRKENIQMRRLIDDPDSRQQPLKILEQKVPVLKEPEHAQIHANARNQPTTSCMFSGFAHLTAKPEIHRGGSEQKRGKRRVPRAVKDVARDYEKIFPRIPGMHAPVSGDDDCKKDYEGERIEKHDRRATAYLRLMLMASTFCQLILWIESELAPQDNVDNVIGLVRLGE